MNEKFVLGHGRSSWVLARAFRRILTGAIVCASGLAVPEFAHAQQKTFHLDRLEVPGAPEDGVALFRPVTNQRNIFYGQLALGYSLRPLRVRNITTDNAILARTSRSSVIQDQLTVYGSAGFQILDRATLGVTFPWAPLQTGENPNYGAGSVQGIGQARTTYVTTGGPTASDLRFDLRGTLLRSDDRKSAFGAQVSIFAPSGTRYDLGGDGNVGAMVMLTGEHTIRWITLVANTGVVFRPRRVINDPAGGSGLGIGNEWRWAVGAFVPFQQGKYRVGATIFGQTGIENDSVIGDTFFTKRNTPIEWQVEGRMRFGPADHWWVGVGAGTRILNGYGAPDFRGVALLGAYVPILDSTATSPERKLETRARWRAEHVGDRDGDGIPDDIDACPNEPEDHLGPDPEDGCPMPKEPPPDTDNDGIPDAEDACPKEPGPRNPDPAKNGCPTLIKVEGSVVHVLQQVHFATGSTAILPDSYPMLEEIATLLRANRSIKRLSIEGHTDNRGGAAMNKKLSQGRADSVMQWLVQHGVESDRLEAHGYGLERPIESNATEQGRAKNRRVDFKIVSQEQ
ncbi:MAG: OmpA family protein [Polyangiaceae bacterium]|nr:OmpA family protein [Polyangiaceae bacterium]